MSLDRRASPLAGHRAIVTGSDVGLGYQTALGLALRGAEVTLGVLDVQNGQRAAEQILRLAPGATVLVDQLDLTSPDSVREFARRQGTMFVPGGGSDIRPLDLLVNNAGIAGHPPVFTLTSGGIERIMATNHLGHFALTALLAPSLLRAPRARVVSLSSVHHQSGDLSAVSATFLEGSPEGYEVMARYAASKLACLMFALELDRRAKAAGVPLVSVAAHPGAARTLIKEDGRGSRKFWRQNARLGARSQLRAATDRRLTGGEYIGPLFFYRGPATRVAAVPQAYDSVIAARLWDASEDVTGVRFDVASLATVA